MTKDIIRILRSLSVLCLLICPASLFADANIYRWEIGIHGGGGYYVGELTPYKPSSALDPLCYGIHARRKFDERWALQLKGMTQRIAGICKKDTFNNPIYNIDLTADFNFFDFGERDLGARCISPYVFIGLGCSIFNTDEKPLLISPYLPIGIGLKWKFHDRMQLQLAWQNNIHLYNGDCLEGYTDKYPLYQEDKQKNFLNNDISGILTAAIIVEFAQPRDKYQNIRY